MGCLHLHRNMGVLQTTVAEIVKVKEHQREYETHWQTALDANERQLARIRSCLSFGA